MIREQSKDLKRLHKLLELHALLLKSSLARFSRGSINFQCLDDLDSLGWFRFCEQQRQFGQIGSIIGSLYGSSLSAVRTLNLMDLQF